VLLDLRAHLVNMNVKQLMTITFATIEQRNAQEETVDVAPQLKTGSAWEQHQYYKLLKVKLVIMARMLAEPVLTPWLK